MTITPKIATVGITHETFKADPFPYLAELREHNPVYAIPNYRKQRAWLVSRYDDVDFVLRSDDFVKNLANAKTPEQLKGVPQTPALFQPLTRNVLYLDPPDHTRLRTLVHKAFTPRMVERMRTQTEELATELLHQARGRRMDLVADYGQPLPARVIGRMLGVPERDSRQFQRWTQTLITLETSRFALFKMVDVVRSMRYLRKLIQQRTREPQDDLISAMVAAKEQDDCLSEDEILAMTFVLINAGSETTVNLIASGTLALLEHPDQWRRLQTKPTLMTTAIEELLRFVSPADFATERYARRDVSIAGATIPQGELTLAVIASANRDATHFADPDRLDVTRQPNKHLAFGKGIHYCVGAPLARLTGQIALSALLAHAPNLRLAVPAQRLRWYSSTVARGLRSLPVAL